MSLFFIEQNVVHIVPYYVCPDTIRPVLNPPLPSLWMHFRHIKPTPGQRQCDTVSHSSLFVSNPYASALLLCSVFLPNPPLLETTGPFLVPLCG